MRNRWGYGVGWFLSILLGFSLAGCGFSTQIPTSSPSGLEQLLIIRSLERAVAKLNLWQYRGVRVHLELFSQINKEYAEAYVATRLQRYGAIVVPAREEADLRLRFFASVLGIDHAVGFFGVPAITPPVVGVTIPEIPLYKVIEERGYSELRIYAFDNRTGEFLSESSPRGSGKANYNRYTALIFIRFTITDVDQPIEKYLREHPEE